MDSIGAYLKNRRETYGLTLDDIYARTKIRHHVIEQIEQDNFSVMPAPYLRSFLRTYCEMVKIEEDEIQSIIAKVGVAPKPTPAVIVPTVNEQPKQTMRSSAPPKAEYSVKPLLIRAFIFAALFLGIVVLIYTYVFKPTSASQAQKEKGDTSLLTVVGNTVVGLIDESVTTDSLVVDLRASDQVWITMTADGKFSRQFLLNANEKRSWSAKEYFLLSVSNAGALEIMRNGKQLPTLGEKGEFVRSVKITKDDLIASSSPYSKQITPSAPAATPTTIQPTQQAVQKPVQQAVQKPAQQAVQKPVQQAVQKPVQQAVQKPVQQAVQKPAQQAVQKPAQQAVQKPVQQAVQKPVKETPIAAKPEVAKKEKSVVEPTKKETAKKEEKTQEAKAEKTKESKKERRERRKRGAVEIESVPLRPVEEGLPLTKPLPKQIPPQ